jgi:hypothetical protein
LSYIRRNNTIVLSGVAKKPDGDGFSLVLQNAPNIATLQFILWKKIMKQVAMKPNDMLNLKPGEWVQVRSEEEISATLDQQGKYRGLRFMPEMKQFCGKKFKVYKRVENIMVETTGEMRKLMSPTVFLEGAICDGGFHQGCHRSCFCFWKEAWLQRIEQM